MKTRPPSACLVLHGKAAMRDDVRAAVRAVRNEGCHVDVRVTWEGGDVTRFARDAASSGFGVVIALRRLASSAVKCLSSFNSTASLRSAATKDKSEREATDSKAKSQDV
jgi:hypothetical protein